MGSFRPYNRHEGLAPPRIMGTRAGQGAKKGLPTLRIWSHFKCEPGSKLNPAR